MLCQDAKEVLRPLLVGVASGLSRARISDEGGTPHARPRIVHASRDEYVHFTGSFSRRGARIAPSHPR